MQYLSLLLVFLWITSGVRDFVFSQQVLPTQVTTSDKMWILNFMFNIKLDLHKPEEGGMFLVNRKRINCFLKIKFGIDFIFYPRLIFYYCLVESLKGTQYNAPCLVKKKISHLGVDFPTLDISHCSDLWQNIFNGVIISLVRANWNESQIVARSTYYRFKNYMTV